MIRTRTAWRAAVIAVAAVSVVLMLAGQALPSPEEASSPAEGDPLELYYRGAFALLTLALAGVGALVAIRRPAHPIGWLFLAGAVLTAISIVGGGVSVVSHREGGVPSFGALILIWMSSWGFAPAVGILVFIVPLLFPTGRLPSPRWRLLLWFGTIAWVLTTIVAAFRAGPIDEGTGLANPFGVAALTPAFNLIEPVLSVTAAPALALTVASVIVRYRRAGRVERLQLRWFLYPASLAAISLAVAFTVEAVSDAGWSLAIGAMALVPLAIGVAILRHRLFEIDRVVSRTLTYAVVTAMLIGVYLGAVLLLQFLLAPFTGVSSPLIVAASTLLVAALVRPILRRVRKVVDRRFNRSRYDGEATVRSLAGRLRDVTDLNRVAAVLTDSTSSALAPRSVSVWLRPGR